MTTTTAKRLPSHQLHAFQRSGLLSFFLDLDRARFLALAELALPAFFSSSTVDFFLLKDPPNSFYTSLINICVAPGNVLTTNPWQGTKQATREQT